MNSKVQHKHIFPIYQTHKFKLKFYESTMNAKVCHEHIFPITHTSYKLYKHTITHTRQSLYNALHYHTDLDITR